MGTGTYRRVTPPSEEASLDPAYSCCGNDSLGLSDVIFQEKTEMWSFIYSFSFLNVATNSIFFFFFYEHVIRHIHNRLHSCNPWLLASLRKEVTMSPSLNLSLETSTNHSRHHWPNHSLSLLKENSREGIISVALWRGSWLSTLDQGLPCPTCYSHKSQGVMFPQLASSYARSRCCVAEVSPCVRF